MDCEFLISIIVRRVAITVLAVFCLETGSQPLANPQSAIRNPKLSSVSNTNSHKIHVSVAQLEFNQKAQSVEIVIRVYADDLENALSQHAKRQVKLDPANASKDKRVGEAVIAYLRDNFELKNKEGHLVKLNWVGLEWQVDMFWLYAEAKMLNGLDGSQLRNRVFFDLYEDQVNIVNTKIQNKQVGLMFEQKDGFKTITNRVMNNPR